VKRVALGLIIAAGLLSASLAAQAVTGTILGSVTDTSNAAVPGATVTLTNSGTGQVRTMVTDAAGEYTAPLLTTGKYKLVAELPGFRTVTLADIDLGVDQRVRLNVKLEIGTVAETVTVSGVSPLVQTSSSELGTTVQQEQIQTLPLNGRNFVNLTRTVPGVVRGIPGANIDGAGSLAWRASASFSAIHSATPDTVACISAPPRSSSVAISPVAALSRGGPAKNTLAWLRTMMT